MRVWDLRRVVSLFGSDPVARLALLRAVWPLAVGPKIADRTQLVSLADDRLHLRASDLRWKRALHRMRYSILSKLRQAVGDLAPRRIAFLDGAPSTPSVVQRAHASDERTSEPLTEDRLPPELSSAAEAIADPELRRDFVRTAARALRRALEPTSSVESGL